MPLQRCQLETSSTEFLDWMAYLKQDVNTFHREDYFWANIAAEIRRTIAKDPAKVNMKSFLLKFTGEEKRKTFVTKEEVTEKSKRHWLSWLGIRRT